MSPTGSATATGSHTRAGEESRISLYYNELGCLDYVLVEGVHDYWISTELSNIFEREGRACLPEDILITAAGR